MVLLTVTFDPNIIVLSFGIAFIGSYMTICVCEHFRLSAFTENRPKVLSRSVILCTMACSLGGVAIWGMHFVGMASMSLKTADNVVVPVKFEIMPTIISLAFVLIFAFAGLYVSSNDVVFCKSKTEIVDMFVKNSAELSSKQIRKLSTWYIFCIISTRSFHHLAGGGLLAGSGVCAMHYLGMWAMSFDGHIIWNKGIISASVLVAATAAFWIMFRLLSLYPQLEILRLGSAFIMAIAVCGMHNAGMSAASYEYDPHHRTPDSVRVWGTMNTNTAFNGALIMSVLFVYILVIMTLSDLRAWLYTTSAQLDKAERLLYKINDNCYSTAIRNYIDRKKAGANGESFISKLSSIIVGNETGPAKQITYEQLDRTLLMPAATQNSSSSEKENHVPKSYSEQRVGLARDHPSLADAMSEYRVPVIKKKATPILLSIDHRMFGSDSKIGCDIESGITTVEEYGGM